ncbi:MAG: hypothetical protein GX561_15170 [Lentisphaerae bacterium]|jgi:N-acetylmuramic acid 6-phosphate etherase|nr:hypothetical protein [Lentisphaerota bacterium]
MNKFEKQAEQFINEETQFHLGFLPTEQSNPLTRTLEADVKRNTADGIRTLQKVDRNVLEMAKKVLASPQYEKLLKATYETIVGGHRVIYSGCGATGRLSIMFECLWKNACHKNPQVSHLAPRVESIMTGGDYALVKSVEFFEDYAVFGRRQVQEAKMVKGDTLVAITEGGETSSVLGTVAEALDRGCQVFLLFNNPADLLAKHLERSRIAIEDPRVTVLDLFCGPMALAGSTRMQATTSEQLIAGAALETAMHKILGLQPRNHVEDFEKLLESLEQDKPVKAMADYTDFEAKVYQNKGKVTYFADDFLLDIFTDTTERSPTFMLPPFRKCDDKTSPPPWTFVKNPLCSTEEAWEKGMRRPLRCLNWTYADYEKMGTADKIGKNPPQLASQDLLKFKVGCEDLDERCNTPHDAAVLVAMHRNSNLEEAFNALAGKFGARATLAIGIEFPGAYQVNASCDGGSLDLMRHLAIKLVLNTISTATMAKLGRVTGNWMSWVDCTNKKLLDRGARLLVEIAEIDYKTAIEMLFEAIHHLKVTPGEKPSPVQVALEWLRRPQINSLQDFLKYTKPAWNLMLDDKSSITPEDMFAYEEIQAEDKITRRWTGHDALGEDFKVTTTWTTTEDGRYQAAFNYKNNQSKTHVTEIQFPLLKLYLDVDAKILLPGDMGFTFDSSLLTPGSYDMTRPVDSMQFAAILRPHGQSIYLDYRDKNLNVKYVKHKLLKDRTMIFGTSYLCPIYDTVAPNAEIPYPISAKPFTGSWFEAAQIYKKWALKQAWCTNRPEVNPLQDIDFWFWNRGLVKDVVPPIEKLLGDCPQLKIALDWYWWHSNPYDTDYPFFWPPREGEETFKTAVKRLTDQGVFTQVYVNGVCWDCDADTWTLGGNEGVMIKEDGTPRAYAFNKYNNHRLAWMCGEAPKHHDQILKLMGKLHGSGLSGQYLDMIGCATHDPCYNPNHSHNLGGGHYVRDGYRKMLQRIKDTYPDYPITTETASENYMDLCDGGIICSAASAERMGNSQRNVIPLFTAVYHGSYALFGNYAHPDSIPPWDPKWPDEDRWQNEKPWHKLYPDQFFVEMARPIAWGAQPMVCQLRPIVYTDPEFAEEYDFIKKTAIFYHDHKDILFHGEMISPDTFSCETFTVDFLSRMIFTKESLARVITKELPTVLHSAWQTKDGKQFLILANVSRSQQAWKFNQFEGTIQPHTYEAIPLN